MSEANRKAYCLFTQCTITTDRPFRFLVCSPRGDPAQQVVVQPQVVAQPRVVTQPQMAQPTRSYRSYSVNPTNVPRGKAGRDGTHAGESTWRHAGAKAHGNYGSGR